MRAALMMDAVSLNLALDSSSYAYVKVRRNICDHSNDDDHNAYA